jgi:CubicO group peptidase (beta-lactamase class C family)
VSHTVIGDLKDSGFDAARLEELLAHARRDVETVGLPACQLALAKDGRLVAFEALGDATTESRFMIFSVTKALVAGATWILVGDGLDPTTRVAELVPGFEANGKDAVTIEHLLLHTAGFPRAPMRPAEGANREERRRRFSGWRLDWAPGTRYEYHPTSAHWVLAEIIERASGVEYRRFVAERVTAPLGLDRLQLGVPASEQSDIAEVRSVGEPVTTEEMERRYGVSLGTIRELQPEIVLRYNEPAVREAGVPGGGGVGTAADVAMYFQALLHNTTDLWDPAVLEDGTLTIRNTMRDPFTGAPANRTRGLVVAGDDGPMRGFPREVGARTFGSPGIGGQVAWADPDSGLSFCCLTNGLDTDLVRAGIRGVSLSGRAAACVPS